MHKKICVENVGVNETELLYVASQTLANYIYIFFIISF